MVEEVSKEFIIENDLNQLRFKSTHFEFFMKNAADAMNKYQEQIDKLNEEVMVLKAEIKEMKARQSM